MATFIASTADISCTFGDKKSKLTVLPSRTIFLNGKPMANISDYIPMVNIAPFGKCRSLANPTVAAATAAHHGHLTPMPCIPNTTQPWMMGKNNVIEKGNAALKKDCKLRCMWAGIISINTDGQNGEGVQPILKIMNNRKSSATTLNSSTPSGINEINSKNSDAISSINEQQINPTKPNLSTISPFTNPKITDKEAADLLPNFIKHNTEEQKTILKIANSLVLSNIPLKETRMQLAEYQMPYYHYYGASSDITKEKKKALSRNDEKLEKVLGIEKGTPMTAAKADKQEANPKYGSNDKYGTNCVTTTASYVMRLRGFNVTAKPRGHSHTDYLAPNTNSYKIWKNADGTDVTPIRTSSWMSDKGYEKMNTERYLEFFNETCKDTGVYQLTINWAGGGGHSTILQRFPNGELRYIEPQVNIMSDTKKDINWLASKGAEIPIGERGILRVDDKIFNTEYADIFETK